LYPTLGLLDFNQTAYDEAKKDVTAAMAILDRHLTDNQFLASHQITLADIAVVCALVTPYRELFAPDYVQKFPNVFRWFSCCVNQPHFVDVIGKFEFAKAERQAVKSGGKKEKKAEHKEEKHEEHEHKKEDKGGKKKDKKQHKEEDAPKEPKKKEKGGKKGKEKEQEESAEDAPAPATSASDALEDAAEAERIAEAKKRNVLDDLPKSRMVLDDIKRLYFKEKPFYKGFWDEFWGGIWDDQGYCAYYSTFKHQEENKLSFMTGNAVSGFLQRLDKARKYMWGVLNISCKDEDTPPYYITGAWIFRGLDIPFEMKDCSDSELHNWTRLDFSKEADRNVLMEQFQNDDLKDGVVIDRKFFK